MYGALAYRKMSLVWLDISSGTSEVGLSPYADRQKHVSFTEFKDSVDKHSYNCETLLEGLSRTPLKTSAHTTFFSDFSGTIDKKTDFVVQIQMTHH